MSFFRELLLTRKTLFSSVSAEKRKKEHDCYLQNGSAVLEELLALCDGNCRIPIRYFSAIEIHNAIRHSKSKMDLSDVSMVTGLLDNRPVLVRFNTCEFNNIHRDIAITAQMSHLKNVLRLVGCCLEFEQPVMVYEYVEGISLFDLLFKKDNLNRKSLCWGNRLRVAREVASAILFLHTEFTTPIIHRDIKPRKVIIDDKSGVAKILDFSLSISLPPGELEVVVDVYGTLGYVDPKTIASGIITQKTDVYSFGVLLFQLLTRKNVNDYEENAKSNTEEGNSMDRVDSTNSKETTDFKNVPTSYFLDHYIKEGNVLDIVDPTILEEHGMKIQQQLEDYLDLVKKCTANNGDDRPYIIHVARELSRIEKCFRA
ncbi:serine/threonine-protein kinase ZRK4-like, partial [Solanum stenotomum]|uniref:serine/threonine-protein kinase ZRK4-like n=1 Tax=Solanum stenotomum TaxID=172797 RepID=UPI0020D02917